MNKTDTIDKETALKPSAASVSRGYSQEYVSIRKTAESNWPAWKVTTYNQSIAVSNHAKKLATAK